MTCKNCNEINDDFEKRDSSCNNCSLSFDVHSQFKLSDEEYAEIRRKLELEIEETELLLHIRHEEKLKKIRVFDLIPGDEYVENLTNDEIYFLTSVSWQAVENLVIPDYFTINCDINYQQMLERLFKTGLLAFSDIDYAIDNATIKELKDFLKEHNTKCSGKKADLIERIKSIGMHENDLNEWFTKKIFKLTEKGESLLKAHEFRRKYDDNYGKTDTLCTKFVFAE
jgi:hypothetical protein